MPTPVNALLEKLSKVSATNVTQNIERQGKCREAFFDSVVVHPHGVMYQSKTCLPNGKQAGVRVTI
jgi:hypothetical protein